MTTSEILRLIQQVSGMTQADLARALHVTPVALNRWMNNKALPRPSAQKRIEELLVKSTGAPVSQHNVSNAKRKYLEIQEHTFPSPITIIQGNPDISDQFALSLTYNTNSIEGSTFSEADTAVVLFSNGTVPRKTLREHLEVSNHHTALEFVLEHIADPIDDVFVRTLHGKLMNGIRDDAGHYRTHAVRIVGTHVPTANHHSIDTRMKEWLNSIHGTHIDIVAMLARSHAEFEQIHPFSDGNGRIGRLLMITLALKNNMAPPVIKITGKREYMQALNRAQMKNEFAQLEECVVDALIEGYKILERKS